MRSLFLDPAHRSSPQNLVQRQEPAGARRPRGRRVLGATGRALVYLLLVALALTMLFPFFWTLSASLKDNVAVLATPPQLWPSTLHWDNYTAVGQTLNVSRLILNSVIVAVVVTALQLLTCAMAAYAFARMRFAGRQSLFVLYLATIMIPAQVTIMPLFMLMRLLHLTNTYAGLILPGITTAFGVFLLRQFFLTLPQELEEAAFLDGASHWTVFWRIALPLARSSLAALAIFAFMASWNSFLWPLLIIDDPNLMTLPLGISTLQGQYSTAWNQIMAGSVISIVPMLLVYLVAQRQFVRGIALSGLKA
jgi:multiple sugar transport system permease protein